MSSSSSSSSQPLFVSSSSSSSGGTARGIYLLRRPQSRYAVGAVQGFRLRVVAYGGHLMDDAIFRYLQKTLDPTTGERTAECDGVCSPVDLEEYPRNEAVAGDNPPYFRLHVLDMVFRSQVEAFEAWTSIVEEVRSLVASLNIMDDLAPGLSYRVGDPPAADAPEDAEA